MLPALYDSWLLGRSSELVPADRSAGIQPRFNCLLEPAQNRQRAAIRLDPWFRWLELQARRNVSANSGGTSRAPRASSAPSARPCARSFAAEYWSVRATTTQASEQNPAESQQSESLPEGNLPPSEQRRQQPVPQMHHHFAANPDEKRDPQRGQQSNPDPFLFLMLCSSFLRSFLRKLVVNALQSFAQMKHRVALAREQGVDAYAAFCRQLFEAAPLQFVSDEYFTLLVGQFVRAQIPAPQEARCGRRALPARHRAMATDLRSAAVRRLRPRPLRR